MSVFSGIDVAARTFDLVSRQAGKTSKAERFQQTPEGHAKAVQRLQALQPALIVLEATGIYYLDLAVALAQAGLPVAVINPKSFHHFAELTLSGSKTDPVDAALLAEYGERMQPRRWTPPDETRLALRDIGRQINRLTGTRTQAKNRLHALRSKRATLALLIEDEQDGIAVLERRIERLSQAALALIAEHQSLSRQLTHLRAAKGVGEATAIAVLAELSVLPQDLKAPQVSRYAGLDVRLTQSGTSVNRPARLSKAGNAYLRAALYMPALSAVRHDPRAKAFYEALVARGKKKVQALCAVMRKYLTGLWACLQTDTAFDSSLLFSDKHMKA
ncbi:IS110 family transposase [Parahaliea mediterranea]|uniref:IS110 family transposase n=1 Tax=Parahaliea mediterranea TaxID=651086 RepID=A0A939IJQ1_9GAMM|nr:IS110 family transposase [Parahaliea mediterranea]MBN7797909.1 IS110 family transposase [Parahaliea mediterranea]